MKLVILPPITALDSNHQIEEKDFHQDLVAPEEAESPKLPTKAKKGKVGKKKRDRQAFDDLHAQQ